MTPDRLQALVAEILDIERVVTDDTGPETEPTWDSLAQLEILITVEEAFGVKFTAEEIADARSVGYIRQLIGERGSAE
jgi:acyl carrier protein